MFRGTLAKEHELALLCTTINFIGCMKTLMRKTYMVTMALAEHVPRPFM